MTCCASTAAVLFSASCLINSLTLNCNPFFTACVPASVVFAFLSTFSASSSFLFKALIVALWAMLPNSLSSAVASFVALVLCEVSSISGWWVAFFIFGTDSLWVALLPPTSSGGRVITSLGFNVSLGLLSASGWSWWLHFVCFLRHSSQEIFPFGFSSDPSTNAGGLGISIGDSRRSPDLVRLGELGSPTRPASWRMLAPWDQFSH